MGVINIGGPVLNLKATGIDETIEKLNLLNKKLEEAKRLIDEIASSKISITFEDNDKGVNL